MIIVWKSIMFCQSTLPEKIHLRHSYTIYFVFYQLTEYNKSHKMENKLGNNDIGIE